MTHRRKMTALQRQAPISRLRHPAGPYLPVPNSSPSIGRASGPNPTLTETASSATTPVSCGYSPEWTPGHASAIRGAPDSPKLGPDSPTRQTWAMPRQPRGDGHDSTEVVTVSTFIERHGLVSYRLNRGRTRTRIYPDGQCEMTDCKTHTAPRVLDHCSLHGWIRGVLCSGHNVMMASIDHGTPGLGGVTNAKLIHFLKCPQCCAQYAWQLHDQTPDINKGRALTIRTYNQFNYTQ
jgi:hypothetical protein